VGTGIGGGVMTNGRLAHGMVHPEIGHLRIPRNLDDGFPGSCPYHGDCLEGLASGPAIAQRWGRPPEELPGDHPAWELEAAYLALGVANLVCTLSPRRIVMGGGVMEQPRLFPLVRRKVLELLNGYVQAPGLLNGIDSYIVPPGLGDRAGVLGAIALAQRACR
jgi:fructokinase